MTRNWRAAGEMDWRLSSIRLNQGRYRDYCKTREHPIQFDHAERAALRKALVARLMGQWLSERLGRPFIVENRPDASGNIGTEAVVRAAPDGYTLLMIGSAVAINATLYDNLNFNFIRDIAPVAGVIRMPNVMDVNPSFPARTVPEFIAYAKGNSGKGGGARALLKFAERSLPLVLLRGF